MHGASNIPTPKNRNNTSSHKGKEDSIAIDITAKINKRLTKNEKEVETSSKMKRSSIHRVKRTSKIPLSKRESNVSTNPM